MIEGCQRVPLYHRQAPPVSAWPPPTLAAVVVTFSRRRARPRLPVASISPDLTSCREWTRRRRGEGSDLPDGSARWSPNGDAKLPAPPTPRRLDAGSRWAPPWAYCQRAVRADLGLAVSSHRTPRTSGSRLLHGGSPTTASCGSGFERAADQTVVLGPGWPRPASTTAAESRWWNGRHAVRRCRCSAGTTANAPRTCPSRNGKSFG